MPQLRGPRLFASSPHRFAFARFQPNPVVTAADADPPGCELGDDRPARCGQDATARAFAKAVEGTPFLEGKHRVVIAGKPLPQRLERCPLVMADGDGAEPPEL